MNGCNYDSVKCYLQKQAPSVELWFVDPSENLSHSKLFETEELTHRKRLWCWEGLGAGEGDNRGWDGWMASRTQWTWVWGNSRSWWWTGRPDVLQFMGLQRVRQDWATELNWTELNWVYSNLSIYIPSSQSILLRPAGSPSYYKCKYSNLFRLRENRNSGDGAQQFVAEQALQVILMPAKIWDSP